MLGLSAGYRTLLVLALAIGLLALPAAGASAHGPIEAVVTGRYTPTLGCGTGGLDGTATGIHGTTRQTGPLSASSFSCVATPFTGMASGTMSFWGHGWTFDSITVGNIAVFTFNGASVGSGLLVLWPDGVFDGVVLTR